MKQNKFDYKKFQLENGVTVLTFQIPHVQSISIRIDIKTGSVFENEKNNGISHLVEHYVHQGSKRYSPEEFRIIPEVEGMFQNGVTHIYGSYYWIKSTKDKLEKALDILFSLTSEPTFPEDRLTHVREVVLQEYSDHYRMPESLFFEELFAKRFKDKPEFLKQAIGNKNAILSCSREEIIAWHKKFYHASNFLITVVGNFDEKELDKNLKHTFEKLPKTKSIIFPKISSNNYSDFTILNHPENREQLIFELSYPCFGWQEKSYKTRQILYLATTILGKGRFSRLFQKLRETYNLVYSISCSENLLPTRGMIAIGGTSPEKNLLQSLQLINEEVKKFQDFGITDQELQIAKNLHISNTVFTTELPENIGEFLHLSEFWNEQIRTPFEIIDCIKSITKEEINMFIKNLFVNEKINIGIFGKMMTTKEEDFKNIFL